MRAGDGVVDCKGKRYLVFRSRGVAAHQMRNTEDVPRAEISGVNGKEGGARFGSLFRPALAQQRQGGVEIGHVVTGRVLAKWRLHVAAIFAAHVVQRVADLAEAVGLHRFHQGGEDVLAVARGLLQ